MAKSEYLETLEKLQNALTQFDMSFGVSNRIFRLALVSEILDTTKNQRDRHFYTV